MRTSRMTVKLGRALGAATLLAGVLAGPVTVVAAAEASATMLQGQFQNWATGGCLDSNFNGDVYTLPCQQGNNYQRWIIEGPTFHTAGYDEWRIQNVATGKCLWMADWFEDTGKVGTSTCGSLKGLIYNQSILGRGPNWSNVQLWVPFDNRCLDTHYVGDAYARECNFGTYETWRLIWRS